MAAFGKFLTIFILTVVTGYYSVNPQSAPFISNLTFQKVLGALGGVFIIVLLVERATEIVISMWRQARSEQLKLEVTNAPKDAAKSLELNRYQAETKSLALLVGFTLSVVVCAAGIGLLGEIVDIKSESHRTFLRGVDIVLTSGLIAGGSDAFHQFVRALETFFVKSKENMQKPTQ